MAALCFFAARRAECTTRAHNVPRASMGMAWQAWQAWHGRHGSAGAMCCVRAVMCMCCVLCCRCVWVWQPGHGKVWPRFFLAGPADFFFWPSSFPFCRFCKQTAKCQNLASYATPAHRSSMYVLCFHRPSRAVRGAGICSCRCVAPHHPRRTATRRKN